MDNHLSAIGGLSITPVYKPCVPFSTNYPDKYRGVDECKLCQQDRQSAGLSMRRTS
jgi:hypothetical protein